MFGLPSASSVRRERVASLSRRSLIVGPTIRPLYSIGIQHPSTKSTIDYNFKQYYIRSRYGIAIAMENRFIEKLRTYGPLSDEAVTALRAATSTPRKVAARHDLIREGDRPGPVFVILEGWACRYKILPTGTRQILAYLISGDSCDLHVGLLAEMDHGIQTITPALVATIGRETMNDLMERYPDIARAMYIAQLIDEGTMRAWITSMGRRASIERVAHLMCELYVRGVNMGLSSGSQFAMPLSQLILADSLGMTPVHLNRVLKELRQSGAMTLQRGSVVITDAAKLIRIAGFDENYLHRRLRNAA